MALNCQFAFGPNRSYVCTAESYFAWSEGLLPIALQRIFDDPRHPQHMNFPHDVALPMEPDCFMLCWRSARGELCSDGSRLPLHYSRLARFLHSTTNIYGTNTTRTTFGPNGSFFSMSSRGYAWQNLPPSLEEELQSALRLRRPVSVALGVNGAYVVLFNDGTVNFDLRGAYPLVDRIIRDTDEAGRRRGIMYLSLNPHVPGEFYLVFGDASAKWNFPAQWSADVTTVSREIKPVAASPAPSINVSAGGTTPRSASMPATVSTQSTPNVRTANGNTNPFEFRSASPAPSTTTSYSSGHASGSVSPVLGGGAIPQRQQTPEGDLPPAYAPVASRPATTSPQSFAALHEQLDHLHLYGSSSSSSSHSYASPAPSLPTGAAAPSGYAHSINPRPASYAAYTPGPAASSSNPFPSSASSISSGSSGRGGSGPTSIHSAPAGGHGWTGDAKSPDGPGGGGRFRVANPDAYGAGSVASGSNNGISKGTFDPRAYSMYADANGAPSGYSYEKGAG